MKNKCHARLGISGQLRFDFKILREIKHVVNNKLALRKIVRFKEHIESGKVIIRVIDVDAVRRAFRVFDPSRVVLRLDELIFHIRRERQFAVVESFIDAERGVVETPAHRLRLQAVQRVNIIYMRFAVFLLQAQREGTQHLV